MSEASATALARGGGLAALGDEMLRAVLDAAQVQRVAGIDQVPRHRAAHDAQSDKTDVHVYARFSR